MILILKGRIFLQGLRFHKGCCKLEYVILKLFTSLFVRGFCRSKEDGEKLEGDMEDNVQGTVC